MNKKSNNKLGFVGALTLAIILLPVAAFARDSEDSMDILPVNTSAHIESEDGNVEVSSNSTTTARLRDKTENSDNHNQDEKASSASRHNNDEHQSITSNHESDETDSEIDIDQESADNATTTIDVPEHVTNHGELRSYLNHIIKEDNRISDVHVSSSTIETNYEMPAKFLWIIPTDLTANVSVASDGMITVKYPWYAFLFAKHNNNLTEQLQQSATSTKASTTVSTTAQAHLLNLLFSALKSSSEK